MLNRRHILHHMSLPVTDTDVTDTTAARSVEILIIGGGFSGIGAAVRLLQNGFHDLLIVDRGDDVGGTWRDNHYPGAACDVPSQLYSLSFAPNRRWTRSFSTQPEIQRYLQNVARTHGLHDHFVGGCEVQRLEWDERAQLWRATTSRGRFDAKFVVGAIGALVEPNLPDIPGIESFEGDVFHSARWNHDVALDGKRVALIGTGASAIQIGPQVAGKVAKLDVYQRTAPWIMPRLDRRYTRPERAIYRAVPGATRIARLGVYLSRETQAFGMTRHPTVLRGMELLGRGFIRTRISDAKTRKAVTPNFRLGCKRILISNTWYPMLNRPNVELVTDGIAEVRPDAIVTRDGVVREVDAIIVATGFHVTDSPVFDAIIGPDGRSLAEVFDTEGMKGYKGTTIHGFPNLFLMVGPNTGLGHTSMVYMIESQLNYLVDAMKTIRRHKLRSLDVTKNAQDAFNADIQQRMASTIWTNGGCSSWYMDKHGNISTLWPGYTFEYRAITKSFDPEAYAIVGPATTPAPLTSTDVPTAVAPDATGTAGAANPSNLEVSQ